MAQLQEQSITSATASTGGVWWNSRVHFSTLQQNADELLNLCKHPHYLQSRFDANTNTFQYRSFRCGGLIKRLKLRFYPNYHFKQVKSAYWRRGIKSSATIGMRVDREVEALVNVQGVRSIDDPRFPPKMSVKTKSFFKRLKELDITPVYAEFPVVCVEKGIGTRIDVIGYRHFGKATQRVVTVERKTGYTTGLHAKQGMLEAPLSHIENSALNQHHLQSFVGALMLKSTYGLRVSEMYVIYTDAKHDHCQKLPSAFLQPRDLAARVWNHLSAASAKAGAE